MNFQSNTRSQQHRALLHISRIAELSGRCLTGDAQLSLPIIKVPVDHGSHTFRAWPSWGFFSLILCSWTKMSLSHAPRMNGATRNLHTRDSMYTRNCFIYRHRASISRSTMGKGHLGWTIVSSWIDFELCTLVQAGIYTAANCVLS